MQPEECFGLTIDHVCVVSGQQEEYKDEGMIGMSQRKEAKRELCKECFWFRVIQNVLENNLKRDLDQLALLAYNLPETSDMFNIKPKKLVRKWQ